MKYFTIDKLEISELNMRKDPSDSAIDGLKASIKASGLLQPLVGYKEGDSARIVAGGRRLTALKELAEEGDGLDKVPVKLIDKEEGTAISIAENLLRKDPEPMDLYRAMSALDMGDQDIADQFGQSIQFVRRCRRIGDVHPDIRKAFEEGKISLQAVQDYAAAENTDEQKAVFDELEAEGSSSVGWKIKELYGFRNYQGKRDLEFVGREAYTAAGGVIEEDLFSEDIRIDNPALLKELVEDKNAKIEKQLAKDWNVPVVENGEGWGYAGWTVKWVLPDEDQERIERIEEQLEKLAEKGEFGEEYANLQLEIAAIGQTKKPVIPEDGEFEYGVLNKNLMRRLKDQPKDDKSGEGEAASETEADAEREDGSVKLSGRATEWMRDARNERFERTARQMPLDSDDALALLILSEEAHLSGASYGGRSTVDHVKLWRELRANPESLRERALELVVQRYNGEPCIAHDALAALQPEIAWESTPEFWMLFTKRSQLEAIGRQFAPDFVEQSLTGITVSEMRRLLHELCTGEGPATRVSKKERKAAQEWIPEWLRFEEPAYD